MPYKSWPEAVTRLNGTLQYYDVATETWKRASPSMAAAYALYPEPPPCGNPWRVFTQPGSGTQTLFFISKPKTGMTPLRIQLLMA